MPNVPRFHDNIRIERADHEFAVDEVPSAVARVVPGNVLTNPSGTRLWILSGFEATNDNPMTALLTVRRGVGLLSTREKGQVLSGVVAFEGDTEKVVDMTAYAVGQYAVWVRAEAVDSDFQNRIFWNPNTQSEYTQSVATRRAANWGVRVEPVAVNPGAEWCKVAAVEVAAGVPPLTVTDARQLYFEGDTAASYAATISDDQTYRAWGGGNDRNADRAQYGVKDLQTFTAAVRSQLASIIGASWWTSVVEPLTQKVSKSGDTLTGHYAPSVDDLYRLGSSSAKWSDIYTNFLHAGQIRRQPAITTADVGTSAARFRKLWFESGDFSAGLTAFGPISFGSALTTDGSIFTAGATRDLGAVTSAASRWNVFANTLDVLAAATFASTVAVTGVATFTSAPRVPNPAPVAKQTATSAANGMQHQSVAAAWCRVSKPAATAYVSAHTKRVHNIVLNPSVVGGGTQLRFDFTHPMANADYAVSPAASSPSSPLIPRVVSRTTTYFDIEVQDWNGTLWQAIDFTVAGGSPAVDLDVEVFGDVA